MKEEGGDTGSGGRGEDNAEARGLEGFAEEVSRLASGSQQARETEGRCVCFEPG